MSTSSVGPATGDLADIPDGVLARFGAVQYEQEGGFPVEQGYIWTTCSAVENANPLFWDASQKRGLAFSTAEQVVQM